MGLSTIEDRRWIRGADDVAIRLRMEDLRQGLSAGILVDAGVVALFLEDGRVREQLRSGNYTLETLLDRLKFWKPGKVVDVVLIARGPHTTRYALEDVVTKDEQRVSLDFDLVLEAGAAQQLAATLLPAPGVLRLAEVVSRLRPSVRRAVDEVMEREAVVDGLERSRVASALEGMLSSAIARFGLTVTDVGAVAVRASELDRLRESRAGDAVRAADADRLEKRAGSLQRLRDALRSEKTGKVEDERALERVLTEVDNERLIEADVRARLIQAFEDQGRAGDRLREIAEEEHSRAREAADRAFHRNQEIDDVDHTIERQTRAHDAELTLRTKEHEQDVREALDGLQVLEAMKRSKSGLRREEDEHQHSLEERRRELEESGHDREQQRELDRLRTLDGVRDEALVAATDDRDRASLIEQMARTKNASDLSPEQLLALAADSNSDAAAALARKFESASDSESKALYERMLQMQQASHDKAQEMALELANKAMETQADVAREASRRTPERVEVTATRSTEARRCQSCSHSLPVRARFCPDCATPVSS
jgi:hypothetical protein